MEPVEDQEEGGSDTNIKSERIGEQPICTELLDTDPKSKHILMVQAHMPVFVRIVPFTSIVMTYAPPSHSPLLYLL